MKVRLFVELELSDEQLLKQFGEGLTSLIASHTIDAGVSRGAEHLLRQLPTITKVSAVFIPELL